jgi:hypothetical protein
MCRFTAARFRCHGGCRSFDWDPPYRRRSVGRLTDAAPLVGVGDEVAAVVGVGRVVVGPAEDEASPLPVSVQDHLEIRFPGRHDRLLAFGLRST